MSKAERGIADAVVAGLRDAAASPSTAMQAGDVPAATAAVTERMAPVLEHLANAEPWYQSRVTWGAIIAAGAGVASLAGYALDAEDQRQLVDSAMGIVSVVTALASVVGGLVAWWGRWRAKRPIGR